MNADARLYSRLYTAPRDPLEVLAETLTQARRDAMGPERITPDNSNQLLPLRGIEVVQLCDDCGGSGKDRGALRDEELCPMCKGSGEIVFFLGITFQIAAKERAA